MAESEKLFPKDNGVFEMKDLLARLEGLSTDQEARYIPEEDEDPEAPIPKDKWTDVNHKAEYSIIPEEDGLTMRSLYTHFINAKYGTTGTIETEAKYDLQGKLIQIKIKMGDREPIIEEITEQERNQWTDKTYEAEVREIQENRLSPGLLRDGNDLYPENNIDPHVPVDLYYARLPHRDDSGRYSKVAYFRLFPDRHATESNSVKPWGFLKFDSEINVAEVKAATNQAKLAENLLKPTDTAFITSLSSGPQI